MEAVIAPALNCNKGNPTLFVYGLTELLRGYTKSSKNILAEDPCWDRKHDLHAFMWNILYLLFIFILTIFNAKICKSLQVEVVQILGAEENQPGKPRCSQDR